MPYWCKNVIHIENPQVFKEKCVKDGVFCFANFIPRPAHMAFCEDRDIQEFDIGKIRQESITAESLSGMLDNSLFRDGLFDYIYAQPWLDSEEEKSGISAFDWYNYNVREYGTKWDIGEAVDMKELEDCIANGKGMSIWFETAWTPPLEALEKMAAVGVRFSFSCCEPDCEIFMNGDTDDNGVFSAYNTEAPEGLYDDEEKEDNEDDE